MPYLSHLFRLRRFLSMFRLVCRAEFLWLPQWTLTLKIFSFFRCYNKSDPECKTNISPPWKQRKIDVKPMIIHEEQKIVFGMNKMKLLQTLLDVIFKRKLLSCISVLHFCCLLPSMSTSVPCDDPKIPPDTILFLNLRKAPLLCLFHDVIQRRILKSLLRKLPNYVVKYTPK